MRSAILLAATWCAATSSPRDLPMPKFALSSPAFKSSQTIPRKYTCDGDDVSPPLSWTGTPPKARSIAVIMEDPDAPAGVWTHWVLYDAPAVAGSIAEGLPRKDSLPDGSKQGRSWGDDAFESVGYRGPCPPKGKPHRYVFRAYALEAPVGLAPSATKAQLLEAMEGKLLDQAELMGLYGR